MRVLITLIILLLFNYAHGDTNCISDGQGGLSCFDYNSGSFTEITPRKRDLDGNQTFDTYNYDTREFGTIRVEPGRLEID